MDSSLLTQMTDQGGFDSHLERAARISARVKAMPSRNGPQYLMLMASGQLLTVIWPLLKASDRKFQSIDILDDRFGSEFRKLDLYGADAVINPVTIPNNTVPMGYYYGVRVLWGRQAPQMPVIRLRAARLSKTKADTNTDVLKICDRRNVTHYQLTSCITPEPDRRDWEFSGTARWIASLPTDAVVDVLRKNQKIIDRLEEARCKGSSWESLVSQLGLESGRADLSGASLVLNRNVIWFDIRERITVIAP